MVNADQPAPRWGLSREVRLAALAVAVLCLGAGLFGAAVAVREDRLETEADLQALATALARSVDLKLTGYESALQTVAQTASLRVDFDLDTTAAHAERVGTLFGGWFTVATGGDTLKVLMTTAAGGGRLPTPEPRIQFPEVMRAEAESIRTGRGAVSDAFPGRVVGELVVTVATPLDAPMTPSPFLYFSVTLRDITSWLEDAGLPPGDFAAIADGSRRVIARSTDNRDFLLADLPEWYVAFSSARDRGVAVGAPANGGPPRVFAMQRLEAAPGWTLAVSRPIPSVWTVVYRSAWPALSVLVALVLGGGIAALLLDRRRARAEADRTARVAVEREGLLRELRAADARKARLMAMLAHDLRTPLVALLGSLDLLQDGRDPTGRPHELERMAREGHGMLQLIDDVLELARLGAGDVRLRPERFDPAPVIEDIAALIRPQTDRRGTVVEVDAMNTPALVGDVAALRRIVLNFASNAVKATEGGRIRLTVRSQPADHDRCTVTFTVSDTGCGIAAADIPLLFRDFGMLDRHNTATEGTGLGLAISRRLADAMGGMIDVESALGKGSSFRLVVALPQAAAMQSADGIAEAENPLTALKDRSILVAEDQETIRRLTCMNLACHGAHTVEASDGVEAVEQAAARRFDLILMDLRMPRLDGAAAAALIRKGNGPSAHAPIVGVTAHQTPTTVAMLSDFAMDACLPKPLDLKRLDAFLKSWHCQPHSRPAVESLFDPVVLDDVAAIDGGATLAQSLADLSEKLATAETEFADRIEAHDLQGVAHLAHRLAGLCSCLGARSLGEKLQALEALCGTGHPLTLREALAAMTPVIRLTRVAAARRAGQSSLPPLDEGVSRTQRPVSDG